MSSEGAKKRKLDGGGAVDGTDGGDAAGMAGALMATVESNCAQIMAAMQREMDSMDRRHRQALELVESKEEIDATKKQIQTEIKCMKEKFGETIRKLQHLDARCDALERSVKLYDKDWVYPVPTVSRNTLLETYHEEYVDEILDLISALKKVTCQMRRGEHVGNVSFDDTRGNRIGPRTHIEDFLLPHWKQFADAVQIYDKFDATDEIYFNVDLPRAVLMILEPAFKTKRFGSLTLSCKLGDCIVDFSVELIDNNPGLKVFRSEGNTFNYTQDADRLVEAIVCNSSIETVSLGDCCRGWGAETINGYGVLCSLITRAGNLTNISLCGNNIETRGGTHLPDFLATNPPLRELDLGFNRLDDNDADAIAISLKTNTNLRRLILFRNAFTDVGFGALRNALFDASTLNSVSDSNHSCFIMTDKGIGGIGVNLLFASTDNNCNDTSKCRAHKIYGLLSTRNKDGANAHHLELELGGEDSLLLAPLVLACVSSYSNSFDSMPRDMEPLSIMYEMVRSWKMPEEGELLCIAALNHLRQSTKLENAGIGWKARSSEKRADGMDCYLKQQYLLHSSEFVYQAINANAARIVALRICK